MKVPVTMRPRPRSENTIPLINIVFLMLIFFVMAGALSPPFESDVDLIETVGARSIDPPNALFVTQTGVLRHQGAVVTPESFIAGLTRAESGAAAGSDEAVGGPSAANGPAIRLAADRALPAVRLVEIVDRLNRAGAGSITIVTERKAP